MKETVHITKTAKSQRQGALAKIGVWLGNTKRNNMSPGEVA